VRDYAKQIVHQVSGTLLSCILEYFLLIVGQKLHSAVQTKVR
jgi:hypothetical protein